MLQVVLLIISFGLGILVVRRLIEIRKSYICPPETVLKEYFEGRLKKRDRREYERVITHLGICEKCQKVLEGYVTGERLGKTANENLDIEDHLIEE